MFPTTRARGLDEPIEWIADGPDSPPKTDLWHTDVAFLAAPPDVAVLNMRETPPTGGDTLWASLYAAHDGLSPTMQDLIADLEQDLHPGPNFEATTTMMFGADVYRRVADEFQGARHPIVRIHPVTGRPALYLCGAYVRGIAGLHPDESDALLDFLRSRLHDPNLQCRWRWRPYRRRRVGRTLHEPPGAVGPLPEPAGRPALHRRRRRPGRPSRRAGAVARTAESGPGVGADAPVGVDVAAGDEPAAVGPYDRVLVADADHEVGGIVGAGLLGGPVKGDGVRLDAALVAVDLDELVAHEVHRRRERLDARAAAGPGTRRARRSHGSPR